MNDKKEKDSGQKELICLEDLFQMKQISEPTFRPLTNEVYYVINQAQKKDNNYRTAIWKVQDNKPKQFSQGLPRDTNIKWSPDGSQLAFISVRGVIGQSNKQNDSSSPKPQIFLIPHDGGEAQQLTNAKNGVNDFKWSTDGSRIVFTSSLNKEEMKEPTIEELKDFDSDIIMLNEMKKKKAEKEKVDPKVIRRTVYRAGTSFKDDRRSQIFVFDIEKKKANRWTDSVDSDYLLGGLTPDNKYVIAVRKKPGEQDESQDHEIVKINAKKEIDIICEVYSGYPVIKLSEDGKYIVTTPQKPEKNSLGFNYIELITVKDGSKKQLADKVDANKILLKWSKDSQKIYFQVMDKGTCGIWRVDVSSGKTKKIAGGDKVIIDYDVSDDNKWLTYQAYHVNDPSKLYLYNLETKEEIVLDEPNAEFLATRKLGSTETIWYDGYNDDYKIQGWILTPPEFDPKKKYPLALNMHGGPHVMWSNHQSIPMFHEFQLLAAQGYVVFYCNPRGSDGYGEKFNEAIAKSWGDKDSQDILLGVDQVVERGYIDTERMAITGGSYAGFLTAWIIGHDNRFSAAVSQRGVYALTTFWGTSDARNLIKFEFFTTPLQDEGILWKYSPAAYAENITTPLMILHSENDFRVPIPDAEILYTAVKHSHPELDAVFVRYPEEGHELSRSGSPKRRLDRLKKIRDWFNKYCLPEKYEQHKQKKEAIENIKQEYQKKMIEKIKEMKKD